MSMSEFFFFFVFFFYPVFLYFFYLLRRLAHRLAMVLASSCLAAWLAKLFAKPGVAVCRGPLADVSQASMRSAMSCTLFVPIPPLAVVVAAVGVFPAVDVFALPSRHITPRPPTGTPPSFPSLPPLSSPSCRPARVARPSSLQSCATVFRLDVRLGQARPGSVVDSPVVRIQTL